MEKLIRVQFKIYSTGEAAMAAGWPDAEWGTWQTSPGDTSLSEGWIALNYPAD